jgi:hypothetical protein
LTQKVRKIHIYAANVENSTDIILRNENDRLKLFKSACMSRFASPESYQIFSIYDMMFSCENNNGTLALSKLSHFVPAFVSFN